MERVNTWPLGLLYALLLAEHVSFLAAVLGQKVK